MHACPPTAYTSPGGDAMQAALAPQRPPSPLRLAPGGGQTVAHDCAGGRVSSEAGRVLRRDIAAPRGLTRALAAARAEARATCRWR